MPRQRATKPQTNFFRGLLTEASPLEYPDNFFEDGDNVELSPKKVSRRWGLNGEPTFQYSPNILKTEIVKDAITEHVWDSPGGDSAQSFYILQQGSTLHFYDNTQSPRSAFKKAFTVNLDSYLAPNKTTARADEVTTAAGFKRLFVSSTAIEPIYISYDPDTDTITVTEVVLEVRDFEDLDDGLAFDDEPSVYSKEHEYNMRSRGWVSPGGTKGNPYDEYFTSRSKYPGKNKQWWSGKNASGDFNANEYDDLYAGTSSAPRGHFIVEAFNKDRASVSGILGLPTETLNKRPRTIAFYAGRIFWALDNTIYFNRSIQADSDIGKCYQEFDPTAEDLSDLRADDGGEAKILGASEILFMSQFGKSLMVYADNGVWAISGADGIFKATEYSINKIADVGIASPQSVVQPEGSQMFWGQDGIYTVTLDQVSQNPVLANSTLQTINSFYTEISQFGKDTAKGMYDRFNKRVRWIYTEEEFDPGNEVVDYTKMLTFDIRLQAWIPSSFPKLTEGETYPAIVGISELSTLTQFKDSDDVEVGGDQVQVSGDDVVILTNKEEADTFVGVKFLILEDFGLNVKYLFGELNETSFVDFKFSDDTGVDYSSYLEPGDEQLGDISTFKQSPYITVFCERTEKTFVDNGDDTYDFANPSSLLLTGYWDWSDDNGRKTNQIQCYRLPRHFAVDPNDLTFPQGHDIIVTKNKLRGKGRTLRLRFESEAGKDFNIHGWSLLIDSNSNV
jgi:hypothetical protein